MAQKWRIYGVVFDCSKCKIECRRRIKAMTNKEIAEWFVEMVGWAKQLPDDYLQDWKNEAREMSLPEEWENAEKWIDTIWKFRTLNEKEFLRFKKALAEAGTSTKAK